MNRKVSVIVPAYNCEQSIEKCIKSILSQNYENIEVIVINDGSSDNTLEKLEQLKKIDERIVIVDKKNGGVSSARNTGISKATGDYIQFVDADDSIMPNMTGELVANMEKQNADIVICGYKKYQNNKVFTMTGKSFIESNEGFMVHFFDMYNNWLIHMPWNKLYKRELINKGFDENISLGEDLLFNLEYFKCSKRIVFIDDCLYEYSFENGASLAGNFRIDKFDNSKMLHNKVMDFVGNVKKNDLVYVMEIRYCFTNLMRSNEDKKKKKELMKKWSKDIDVINAYENASGLSKIDKIMKFFIIHKKPMVIYHLLNLAVR